MMAAPFTMNICFMPDGKDYYVTLENGEESRKFRKTCREEENVTEKS
jgi:hypothetical protein